MVVSLARRFAYDALSPDGRTLYLIEHLADPRNPGRYQVRAFDLATGRLQPGFIADKRELDEPMAGYPLARASTPDGAWVYTLYQGPEHAFVHALAAADGYALCIDLPGGAPRRDAAAYWGLALAGDTVYAANAALGVAAALNGQAGEVERRASLPTGRPPRPDARTLHARARPSRWPTAGRCTRSDRQASPRSTRSASARRSPAADRSLAGIAVSPDAQRLYAVDAATRSVLAFDRAPAGGSAPSTARPARCRCSASCARRTSARRRRAPDREASGATCRIPV